MSIPSTLEQLVLRDADQVLLAAENKLGRDARPAVLEGAASAIGGWSLEAFRGHFGSSAVPDTDTAPFVIELVRRLADVPVPAPISIAALGRVSLSRETRRTQGAFYTDFRLAKFVAEQVATDCAKGGHIIDLAAGSGILLVATVLAAANGDARKATRLVAESVCAADLDPTALRACRASLAAACNDLDAVIALSPRLRCVDSLIAGTSAWADVAENGFDVVVGNPPWEKVKVSRHEFLRANGHDRHYGDQYAARSIDVDALAKERAHKAGYAESVAARYPLASNGELDLYKAFLACSLEAISNDGTACLLLPAGLIRSQGTEPLRRHLFETCGVANIAVIENRARFFPIDTRFKFLVVLGRKRGRRSPIQLSHISRAGSTIKVDRTARIGRGTLCRIRPDLTVPEVRSDREWALTVLMHDRGTSLDHPSAPFQSTIVREVDMTRDRPQFSTIKRPGDLPLVEGRMIAQHRFGAKAYRSGTGRRALWDVQPAGSSIVAPQFYYPKSMLTSSVVERTLRPRIGFCDVTGQTNERTIIAARIPAGVVCGNKVPTITFENDDDGHLSWLFLGIANSLPFDWIARRLLTTSVNYFVLRSIPLPPIAPHSVDGDRIANLAQELAQFDAGKVALSSGAAWHVGEIRSEIDARVLMAWGLAPEDLSLMLDDFPLLDRGQPALLGEPSSTVTRDLVLSWAARLGGVPDEGTGQRAEAARTMGALAYIASEYAEEEPGEPTTSRADLLAGDPAG